MLAEGLAHHRGEAYPPDGFNINVRIRNGLFSRHSLLVGDTVRCPWHHACFSLRTGAPVRAPALDPVERWRIERQGDMLFVRQKLEAASKRSPSQDRSRWPESVVIIGGGGAGLAAADVLRRQGYDRPISVLSADDSPPCDRPNLSKDYLAGTAQEDWIPLRAPEFYADRQIELSLNSRATGLDIRARQVQVEGGRTYTYGALLIATGADPVRLTVPGADRPHVRYLRTFAKQQGDRQRDIHRQTGRRDRCELYRS